MKEKTVYVNQWQGKDENDGLSEDAPVLTRKLAEKDADELRQLTAALVLELKS